jgi:hypothetical protein
VKDSFLRGCLIFNSQFQIGMKKDQTHTASAKADAVAVSMSVHGAVIWEVILGNSTITGMPEAKSRPKVAIF